MGPIVLFSSFKLTTSSEKHLEDNNYAHKVSLKSKLITSAEGCDVLSIGFDRDRNRRRDELTNSKYIRGKNHPIYMPKDVFGFAKHQEKATYGLGYKLTLTKNKDEAVVYKAEGIADAGIKVDHNHWYVPHYTPSIQQQGILFKQVLNQTPLELR